MKTLEQFIINSIWKYGGVEHYTYIRSNGNGFEYAYLNDDNAGRANYYKKHGPKLLSKKIKGLIKRGFLIKKGNEYHPNVEKCLAEKFKADCRSRKYKWFSYQRPTIVLKQDTAKKKEKKKRQERIIRVYGADYVGLSPAQIKRKREADEKRLAKYTNFEETEPIVRHTRLKVKVPKHHKAYNRKSGKAINE